MKEQTMEEKLKKYKKCYIDSDKSLELYQKASCLYEDLKYLEMHHRRTRTSDYHVKIIPSLGSVIMDTFFQTGYKYSLAFNNGKDGLVEFLKTYHITYTIMNKISVWDENRKIEDMKEAIDWAKVVMWYLDIELKENIHNFCGCSAVCEQVIKCWNEVEKE